MNPKALQIVGQVKTLYHRYGIKSVTMDDVASHLGISKKTLYEHFHDKEDLVQAVLMFEHDQSCGFMENIIGKHYNAIEELFEVYKMIHTMYHDYNPSMVYDVRKYYPALFSKLKEIRRQRMYESVVGNMEKGKREGFYRHEIDAAIVSKLHVLRTEALFSTDIFTPEELTSFSLFHELFIYHIHGILNQAGRDFFEANFDKFKATL